MACCVNILFVPRDSWSVRQNMRPRPVSPVPAVSSVQNGNMWGVTASQLCLLGLLQAEQLPDLVQQQVPVLDPASPSDWEHFGLGSRYSKQQTRAFPSSSTAELAAVFSAEQQLVGAALNRLGLIIC